VSCPIVLSEFLVTPPEFQPALHWWWNE